jgi:hypothetical protein
MIDLAVPCDDWRSRGEGHDEPRLLWNRRISLNLPPEAAWELSRINQIGIETLRRSASCLKPIAPPTPDANPSDDEIAHVA